MSLQDAKEFLKKLEADPALKEQFKTAPDAQARQKMVKDAGCNFTPEEFKQAVDEIVADAGDGELSEEQLDAVAGAGWGCAFHWAGEGVHEVGHEVGTGLHEAGHAYNEAGNEAEKL